MEDILGEARIDEDLQVLARLGEDVLGRRRVLQLLLVVRQHRLVLMNLVHGRVD